MEEPADKEPESPPPKTESKSESKSESESKPESSSESKPAPPSEAKEDLAKGDRIFASPIAKKLALERGIPLGKVKGSGPNGRIIRADVEGYKASEAAPEAAKSTPSKAAASKPAAAAAESNDYTDTPISNMRRTIGTRLTQSKQELPHYYLTVDIDMGKTMKLRELFNKSLAEKEGAEKSKLSVNDFIVKAAACALRDVPEVNSAWLGEVIRQ